MPFRSRPTAPPADAFSAVWERLAHIEDLAKERNLRYQQRFEAQEKAVATLLTAQEKALLAALSAQKEAVERANSATERRFDSVNEFRQTLSDQARDLMPRLECESRIKQISDEIAVLRGTARGGATSLMAWVVGSVGLVTGVIGLIARFSG
jgi:hypothetical protein